MNTPAEREPAPVRPVTILYIAGMARTGSTVLGELLGRVPDVAYVGELSQFWRRYSRRELCSCGRALPECGFWSRVVDEAFGDLPAARVEQFIELERRLFRRRALRMLWSKRWATGSLAADEMLEERSQLYAAASKVSGSRWIVDASKSPFFGASLACLSDADLDVVQIVRDPRGVTYSWRKQVQSDSEPSNLARKHTAVAALQWIADNLMTQLALRRLASRYVLIRYEDLVAGPEAALRRVAEETGLPLSDPQAAVDDVARPPADHHRVAGNPGVRRLGNAVHLSLDDEWRSGLPFRTQRLITALCALLMVGYGYPLRVLRRPPP
ncbi:MAG: sulfotransferase [Solirubrobacteraceae bacterium]|jgi:hypothetical protein